MDTLHIADRKQGDQLEPSKSTSVKVKGVPLTKSRKREMIGRGGEKGIQTDYPRRPDEGIINNNKKGKKNLPYSEFCYSS